MFIGFYAAINLGAIGAISASFLARDHGYWVAYLVPTSLFVFVPLVMVFGKKNYHLTPPRGSVLLDTMRVIRLATKGRWSLNPATTYHRFEALDFWDNAMPSHYTEANRPKKMLWDDEFVREVSRTLKACLVFPLFPRLLAVLQPNRRPPFHCRSRNEAKWHTKRPHPKLESSFCAFILIYSDIATFAMFSHRPFPSLTKTFF